MSCGERAFVRNCATTPWSSAEDDPFSVTQLRRGDKEPVVVDFRTYAYITLEELTGWKRS
jgi:hypothetical protein